MKNNEKFDYKRKINFMYEKVASQIDRLKDKQQTKETILTHMAKGYK